MRTENYTAVRSSAAGAPFALPLPEKVSKKYPVSDVIGETPTVDGSGQDRHTGDYRDTVGRQAKGALVDVYA